MLTRRRKVKKNLHLAKELSWIFLGIGVAVVIARFDLLHPLVSNAGHHVHAGSFFAGIFFSSMLTTPVATVALGEISLVSEPWVVAFWGALGAVIGDLILFFFIREHLSNEFIETVRKSYNRRLHVFFHGRMFRRLSSAIGALIIMSPIPDELGLKLMGISHKKPRLMFATSFAFNFAGILLTGFIARMF